MTHLILRPQLLTSLREGIKLTKVKRQEKENVFISNQVESAYPSVSNAMHD